MHFLRMIFLLLCALSLYAEPLEISKKTEFAEVLPHAKVYIDKSRELGFEEVLNKREFQENNASLLGFGFSPEFDVWLKFTLKNDSDKPLQKIIEYANPLSSYIEFYDPSKNYEVQKDGLFSINTKRETINPIFYITIDPHETKTYYLKASAYITTLIIKLDIWDIKNFYENEMSHQLILALFFGAISILGIYNLFIFFFTRDISYLFYFLYIGGLVIHHAIYKGIGVTYLLNQEWVIHSITYASLISSFPIFALALFTKSFLHVKTYPKLNTILNIFLILLPLSVLLFVFTSEFNHYRNILVVIMLGYLLFITIYSALKRNRQAYFILLGWCAIFLAILFMLLSSTGVFDIYSHFPYFIEASLVFEAVIFSIALADKIKQLQKDKEKTQQKLILQQESEKERLSALVQEKTANLTVALKEKNLLLKELNHRVKNNMQMIVSLIRLQSSDIKDDKLKEVLTTIQNRINTMKHLHELLYIQEETSSHVDTYRYFELIIDEITESYLADDIDIAINIQTQLPIEQAIYCGIMLNELVTNTLKYAFKEKKGKIEIRLKKEDGMYHLFYSDNGVGYNPQETSESLGLTLVHTLTKVQLKGDIEIDSQNGVKVYISWRENEKNLDTRR